jgi:5-methylcytosine-specific restriction endonuclease McrA
MSVFDVAAELNESRAEMRLDAIRAELSRREAAGNNYRRSLNHRPVRTEVLSFLLARDGCRCVWCGEYFVIDLDAMCDPWDAESDVGLGEKVAIDHIQPISKGGDPWDLGNLQVLHLACNIRKGNKWLDERGRLA